MSHKNWCIDYKCRTTETKGVQACDSLILLSNQIIKKKGSMDKLINKLTELKITQTKPVLLSHTNWDYKGVTDRYSTIIVGDFVVPIEVHNAGVLRTYSRRGNPSIAFKWLKKRKDIATRVILAPIATTEELLQELQEGFPTALIVVTTTPSVEFVPNSDKIIRARYKYVPFVC
jgi:hypothetical protein